MTTCPSLTVAVATLDRPQQLARCLRALLAGRRLPAEIIVVDQGTTDASEEVVRALDTAAVPIVLMRQQRRGLSASRNAAVARARCAVVAVTDDDCVPDQEWVASLERAFASSSSPDAVTGRVLSLGPPTPGTYAISLRTSEVATEYATRVAPWHVGTGANFAAHRRWFDRAGGYDERLGAGSPGQAGEDADLLDRLLRLGARIRFEPAGVVYHERCSLARRLATRRSYGHGVGAMCGLRLREGDWFGLRMLAHYVAGQARAQIHAARIGERGALRELVLSFRGLLSGLAYGLAHGPGARRAAGLDVELASQQAAGDVGPT